MTQTITMTYRNWRGEIAEREIAPISIWFGHTDWHTEPQWLLRATDVEKEAERDFALADCQFADLRVPAPAVPDDVAEIANTLRKATFTKGRTRGGIGGQTIEANMRSTFHEVSAWDLDRAADALEAQAAELARLREGYSKIQEAGLGGYLTPELVAQITRAALTQPTGD